MRQFITSCLLAVLAGILGVGPVGACIWDRSTYQKEQEFKSQYEGQEDSPVQPQQPVDLVAWWAIGSGVALLVGAAVIAVPRVVQSRRKRAM